MLCFVLCQLPQLCIQLLSPGLFHPGLPVLRGLTASAWSEILFPLLTSLLGTAAPCLVATPGALCLLVWSQLSSSQQQAPPVVKPCPVGIPARVTGMRESAPTEIAVRKQSSRLTRGQGAGPELICVCADRWSDLKYSLQIPLSPGKAAGS